MPELSSDRPVLDPNLTPVEAEAGDHVVMPSPGDVTPGALGVLEAEAGGTPDTQGKRKWGLAFWLAVGWMAVVLLHAILADYLPWVHDPNEADFLNLERGPMAKHWFGVDDIGR